MDKLILILSLILLSCSAQKRMNKLIDNNPDLVVNDTIRDTIITEEVRVDTALLLTTDTIILRKDNLIIETPHQNNC